MDGPRTPVEEHRTNRKWCDDDYNDRLCEGKRTHDGKPVGPELG